MNRKKIAVLVVLLVASLLLATAVMAAIIATATIDFEGLAEGTKVSSVSPGNGITVNSGTIGGSVAVTAQGGSNDAMIFDAECTGGCTGGDDDLHQPGLGNVLIVSEDGDSSDPDDSDDAGASLTFNFSGFGPGIVTVDALTLLDIEEDERENAFIEFYDASDTMFATVDIPDIGDGNAGTVFPGVSGVTKMVVVLDGSGAVDNIEISIEEEEEGDEGCTPGYWKNHTDAWEGYSPDQTVESVFDVPDAYGLDNDTLLEALKYGGGPGEVGAAKILLRAAVAALLNADNGSVNYPHTVASIIADVNAALSSADRDTMLNLASSLDTANNAFCPLN